MKKTGIVVAVFLLLGMFLMACPGAQAATDGFYTLSPVSEATWYGTDASRTKTPTADYDYTYGDESSVAYTLPWAFSFYGQSYSQINVDTNGNIWFAATDSVQSFDLATTGRGPVIAAWNDDLSSYYYGGVFIQHKTDPERVVIEWQTETYTEEGTYLPNDFEVVLYPNGSVRLDYKSFTTTYGNDFGSGISKGDGTKSISLTGNYGTVPTLAGRSFAAASASVPPLTVNPVPPTTTGAMITLSGTSQVGSTVTITSDSGATVGPVTFTDPITWQCTVSISTLGDNTFTVTAANTSVPVWVDYEPPLTITLSRTEIAADYQGSVVVTINNVKPRGGEVLIEQLVDVNGNGTVDMADYVIRSLKLIDGAASANPNVLGDDDGTANNTITASLGYFLVNDLYHASGNYLFRVTEGNETKSVSFKVDPPVTQPQIVAGTVTDGANPVPGALVRLTDKWQRPAAWAVADENGRYTLDIRQPGDYVITPFAYGYATSSPGQLTTVAAGQSIIGLELPLTLGTFNLSGLLRKELATDPVCGVWMIATGTSFTGVAITDTTGSYRLALPADQYEVAVANDQTLPNPSDKGYLSFAGQPLTVDLAADIVYPDIALVSAEMLVSGKVVDSFGAALPGMPIQGKLPATTDTREPVAFGVTNASGDYTLGVIAGTAWDIMLDDPPAQTIGNVGTGISGFSTSYPRTGNDLTAYPITAWVGGTVKDLQNVALPGVEVKLRNEASTISAKVKTALDGTYRLGAFAGDWLVNALTLQSTAQQAVTLADGQTATVNFIVDNSPKIYAITASAGANGSISPAGSVSVTNDYDQAFSFTPNTGYQVSDVMVDGVSMGVLGSYTFTHVTTNHTISVTFLQTTTTPGSITVPASNTTGSIQVSWSYVAGATYVLEYNRDGGTFTSVYNGSATATTVNVGVNGNYTFRVKAIKTGHADSAYTTSGSCAVTLQCGAPASITAPANSSTGSFFVSWGVSNISGVTYVLEYSKDGGAWIQVVSTAYTNPLVNVSISGNYTFRVKATKAGYADSVYTISTNCVVTLQCGAPASINVPANNSTGSFYVSWGVSNVSGSTYVLEYSKDGGAWTQADSTTFLSATVNLSGIGNGNYIYRVKATKAGYADSAYIISTNCVVTLQCGAPASITVPANNSTGSFYVSWGVSNINGVTYVLEYSKDGGAWTQVVSTAYTNPLVNVSISGNYTFRVKATKAGYADSVYTISTYCAVTLN
jgi:predicted secreted protein